MNTCRHHTCTQPAQGQLCRNHAAQLGDTRRHGTVVGYTVDGCRCDDCRAAHRAYMTVYRRDRIITGRRTVDAEPVRAHVHALMKAGVGWKHVAALARVGNGTIARLIYGAPAKGIGPSKRIDADRARLILEVTPDSTAMPDHAWVDAAPTLARIAMLRDHGWTVPGLCQALGRSKCTIIRPRERVTGRLAKQVAWLAEHCPYPPEWARDRRPWARERAEARRVMRERQRAYRAGVAA